MFRRRPRGHVWPPLRPWARPAVPAPIQKDLQHANQLLENGDFANAATIYEKIARSLHDQGRPRQAAHLYLQAAQARFLAGQIPPGLDLAQRGLGILADGGFWEPFDRQGSRLVNELNRHNQPQTAQELSRWIAATKKGQTTPETMTSASRSPALTLPLKCPFCGASVRSDEVVWANDTHAECAYCGSPISGG
jgi:hypothetical protein